jgi:hypothetical protein
MPPQHTFPAEDKHPCCAGCVQYVPGCRSLHASSNESGTPVHSLTGLKMKFFPKLSAAIRYQVVMYGIPIGVRVDSSN